MRASVDRRACKADHFLCARSPALNTHVGLLSVLNFEVCGYADRFIDRNMSELLRPVIRGRIAVLELARNCERGVARPGILAVNPQANSLARAIGRIPCGVFALDKVLTASVEQEIDALVSLAS